MLTTALHRRIVGTASMILVLALGWVLARVATAPTPGSYEVTAILGRAGAQLIEGTDVKVRGARIGEVVELDYVDQQAVAVLRLEPEPRIPLVGLEMTVEAKTLLGEKQIQLSYVDERFGVAPFLSDGDTIVATREPTELAAVLGAIRPVLDSIDPQELADLVEAFAVQEGDADVIRGNLDVGSQLADFGDRTSDDVLARFRALTSIANQLTVGVDDLTRMSALVDDATRVLVTRTADIDRGLSDLSRLSVGLAEFLEVERDTIRTLLATGEVVGAMLDRNLDQIGVMVDGIGRYATGFGRGGPLDDDTQFAWFRILIGDDPDGGRNMVDQFCFDAGPAAALVPLCAGRSAR